MNALKLKLTNQVVPVDLEMPEGIVQMELREMNAADRDGYLDSLASRMRLDASGQPAGVKKFEGLQSSLLARCLTRKDGKPLTEKEIQAWPASVVSELFKAAQAINHLGKEAEAQTKND